MLYPKQFGNRSKQIGITAGTAQLQKTILVGTARIFRKVLEMYWLWLDFKSIFQYNNNNNNNNNSNNNNNNNKKQVK